MMNPVVLLLVAVSCCMAAGGGMGGGALLVPIFLVVAQLEARTAIGLSNVTICCGALASFLINIQRRHPHKRAPLIDWSMVLMLEPLTVLGALVGGYVNKVQPPWLTTLLLGVLLLALTGAVARKAHQQLRAERALRVSTHPPSTELCPTRGVCNANQYDDDDDDHHDMSQEDTPLLVPTTMGTTAPAAAAAAGTTTTTSAAASSKSSSLHNATHATSAVGQSKRVATLDRELDIMLGLGPADPHCTATNNQLPPCDAGQSPSSSPSLSSSPSWTIHTVSQPHGQPHSRPHGQPYNQPHGTHIPTEGHPKGHCLTGDPPPSSAPSSSCRATAPSSSCRGIVISLPSSAAAAAGGVDEEAGGKAWAAIEEAGGKAWAPMLVGYARGEETQQQWPQVPWLRLCVLFALLIVVVVTDICKRLVLCGSVGYWLITLTVVPVAVGVWWVARWQLLRGGGDSDAPVYDASDVSWTARNTVVYPLISTAAGLMAGMFGIGGGLVKGPLMLHLGLLPDVAAATSSTMVLLTSASSTMVYASFGAIPLALAWPCGLIGFAAALLGQLVVNALVLRLNRRSLVVLVMVVFVAVASVVVLMEGVVLTRVAVEEGMVWVAGTVCEPLNVGGVLRGGG